MRLLLAFSFLLSMSWAQPPVPRSPPRQPISRIPTSKLSLSVLKEQTPTLKFAFRDAGFVLGAPIYLRSFKYSTPKLGNYITRYNTDQSTRNRMLNLQWYTEAGVELWVQKADGSGQYGLFKRYPTCVYSGKLGPKLKEGDLMTPEGFYEMTPSAFNPNSQYRLSVNFLYPNKYDRLLGRTGGFVMIHGYCVSVGCLAMNEYIDEIYSIMSAAIDGGQSAIPLHSFPFPMTQENIDLATTVFPSLKDFWSVELKPAFDRFEATQIPPKITIDVFGGQNKPVYKLAE